MHLYVWQGPGWWVELKPQCYFSPKPSTMTLTLNCCRGETLDGCPCVATGAIVRSAPFAAASAVSQVDRETITATRPRLAFATLYALTDLGEAHRLSMDVELSTQGVDEVAAVRPCVFVAMVNARATHPRGTAHEGRNRRADRIPTRIYCHKKQ